MVSVKNLTPIGFEQLIDPSAELVKIGEGYQFSEGPVWNQREQALYFSDIPGDTRWRWTKDTGMQVAATPTFKGNGLAFDVDGSLLVCEQVNSCLSRIRPDGRRELVAWHIDGVYLNSPNDVVVRSDGSIYFTDPDYGRWNDWIGCKREPLLGYTAVFRVPHEGGPAELVTEPGEFEQPNGLCFSPDESLLYVNDSPRAHIKVWDVDGAGNLSKRRLFFDGIGRGRAGEGVVDGMKCDARGNVWVTGPGGVWVISPAAEHLGTIRVPESASNLAWGGEDWRTLFITASTSLYALQTLVGPRREPYMR